MMKRFMILFLALGVMFLAIACAPVRLSCLDDGACTLDEKYIGSCSDCKPDFAVSDQDVQAYYDPKTGIITSSACVKNINGDYQGNLQIGWQVCDSEYCQKNYEATKSYFSPAGLDSYAYFNVRKGQAWFDASILEREQVACFMKEFNVGESRDYYVFFMVNGDRKVGELKYDNNNARAIVRGESYPDFLIEKNIDESIIYSYSRFFEEHEQEFVQKIYQAGYDFKAGYGDPGYYVVYIIADSDEKDADRFLNYMKTLGSTETILLSNGREVYLNLQDSYEAYFWRAGSLMVSVERLQMGGRYAVESDPVALAYSNWYAPAGTTCGNRVIESGEVCDGDNMGLVSAACSDYDSGFTAGTLSCGNDCNLDTSGCIGSIGGVCGDGIVQPGEECDTSATKNCTDFGFDQGIVLCNECSYDTSLCSYNAVAPTCGNGNLETGESCDGDDLGGLNCFSFDKFIGGTLSCTEDCKLNTIGCVNIINGKCGDGVCAASRIYDLELRNPVIINGKRFIFETVIGENRDHASVTTDESSNDLALLVENKIGSLSVTVTRIGDDSISIRVGEEKYCTVDCTDSLQSD